MRIKSTIYFIIDFDSTFTKVEALDELCEISLKDNPNRHEVLSQIQSITDKGMTGAISLRQSLDERVKLLKAKKEHLSALIGVLNNKVSDSFMRNKQFLNEYSNQIYIVSNGFVEFIAPVVARFGISPDHVLANSFVFDDSGNITGFDESNVLSENHGKAKKVAELALEGEILVIGDGYTDYEIKESGKADLFFAFTENVSRPKVIAKADYVVKSLDEVLTIIQ